MIHLVPMEPTPNRYSADWFTLWPTLLRAEGFETRIIAPDDTPRDELKVSDPIRSGAKQTWDGAQAGGIATALQRGSIRDGDVLLFTEGHSFTVLAAAYMRAAMQVGFKIAILLHAGTWDPWDFLNRYSIGAWMADAERAIVGAADSILLATQFHKELLLRELPEASAAAAVTGYPLTLPPASYAMPWEERTRSVVFPHRLAPEKGVDDLQKIEQLISGTGVEVVKTQDLMVDGAGMGEYYKALGSARVVLSCAYQETWGIAQLEGWSLGAHPVVPDRLSYPELYAEGCLYASLDEAAEKIVAAVDAEQPSAFEPLQHPDACGNAIAEELRRLQC